MRKYWKLVETSLLLRAISHSLLSISAKYSRFGASCRDGNLIRDVCHSANPMKSSQCQKDRESLEDWGVNHLRGSRPLADSEEESSLLNALLKPAK